jgi:RimJ/RimL family protein N-acetyltransferase
MKDKAPVLRDFPHSFDTERLTIRCPLPGDGAELNAAVIESWERLNQWMPWAIGEKPTLEESEANVRLAYTKFLAREDLRLSLLLKGTDTLVGGSGLHRMNWSVPSFEIGYWVRTKFEGQGFITEAVAGITEFAVRELGARRIEIRCDGLNERSAAVPRRLNFDLEGTLRNDERHHLTGELRDTLIFAKIVGER